MEYLYVHMVQTHANVSKSVFSNNSRFNHCNIYVVYMKIKGFVVIVSRVHAWYVLKGLQGEWE